MRQLGRVADEQGPALATLSSSSKNLKRFFDDLGPFATRRGRPSRTTLGNAAAAGTKAVAPARETVKLLTPSPRTTPELAKNLAITLEAPRQPRQRGSRPTRAARAARATRDSRRCCSTSSTRSSRSTSTTRASTSSRCRRSPGRAPTTPISAKVRKDTALAEQCTAALGPRLPGINTSTAPARRARPSRGPRRASAAPPGHGRDPHRPQEPAPPVRSSTRRSRPAPAARRCPTCRSSPT